MAAGVTDRLWGVSNIAALLEAVEPKQAKRNSYKKRISLFLTKDRLQRSFGRGFGLCPLVATVVIEITM
jgi:hypothetical protein